MANVDVLYERPGLTGIVLGAVLQSASYFVATDVAFIAFLLFAFGTVVAIWSDDWWGPAGQALSVAGAFVILVIAVRGLLPSP